jgi:alpha-glucosidase
LEAVVGKSPLLIEFRDARTHKVINSDALPMSHAAATRTIGAAKKFPVEERYYGRGEKAAKLDKRRGQFSMWNSDTPAYKEGTDPIYQDIPFYLGWQDFGTYGIFFDNSYRTNFDFGLMFMPL